MVNPEFFDEPAAVVALTDEAGNVKLQSLTWREKQYPIVTNGRQWDDADGRSILVEAGDGARFELQLNREDLIWRVKRVWPGTTVA